MLALVLTAAATGFAGSVHCAAMCGPFACGVGASWRDRAAYHATRVAAYAFVGALAGVVGRSAVETASAPLARAIAFAVAAGLLVAASRAARGAWRAGSRTLPTEPKPAPRPRFVARVARRAAAAVARSPLPRPVAFGLVNALFPCGLLYGALGLAAATRDPLGGALALAAFGAGSAPALALGAGVLVRLARFPRAGRLVAAVGLATGAVLVGARAWRSGTDAALPCHGVEARRP